jgi:hypothetical protein
VRLPGPGEVDHDRLVIPAGPWLADQWLVEDRPGTVPRAVSGNCNVAGCAIAGRSALRGEREEDAALPVSWRRWTAVTQRARR